MVRWLGSALGRLSRSRSGTALVAPVAAGTGRLSGSRSGTGRVWRGRSRTGQTTTVLIAVAAVVVGFLSPAAGIVLFGYGLALRQVANRRRQRLEHTRMRTEALEMLAAAAADLRAGAPPSLLALPDRELHRLARAAQRLSDRTGAPLAELLDRVESHHRGLSRLDNGAHAQAAGIRLTAMLLAALPLAALGLGHLIGADALGALLRTPLGTASTAAAVALQLAGLAWADRLARLRTRPLHDELAVSADLMAAALRAGAPVSAAVAGVGEVLEGPLSARLVQIGRELRAGVSPTQAWQRLADLAPARRLINAARRSAQSGAALSGALVRCADDLRSDAAHERQAQAQRAAVLLVLPLGLCFLPAFVLGGLVPVVLAVLGEVL